MQTSLSAMPQSGGWPCPLGWSLLPLLAGLFWLPEIKALSSVWQSDSSLSHGPLVPQIVLGLLWMRRDPLRGWNAADSRGLPPDAAYP